MCLPQICEPEFSKLVLFVSPHFCCHLRTLAECKMSDLDVSKMKVAELRSALQERGLDTKGVKAVLQERLLSALSEEVDSPAPESVDEEDAEDGEQQEGSGDGEENIDEVGQEQVSNVTQLLQ